MTEIEKVREDWRNLRKIDNQTEEICQIAIDKNKKTVKYIRDYDLYNKFGGVRRSIKLDILTLIIYFVLSIICLTQRGNKYIYENSIIYTIILYFLAILGNIFIALCGIKVGSIGMTVLCGIVKEMRIYYIKIIVPIIKGILAGWTLTIVITFIKLAVSIARSMKIGYITDNFNYTSQTCITMIESLVIFAVICGLVGISFITVGIARYIINIALLNRK